MLEIKVQNTNLDLLPNTKLSFSVNSTIWDFNQISGSYTLPFELPLTPQNQKILDFPFHGTVGKPDGYSYECEIYVKGVLFKNGSLTIEDANNDTISASILVNISKIHEHADTKLSELDIFGGEQPWTWKSQYWPEADGFVLPQIEDETFLDESLFPARNRKINEYDSVESRYKLDVVLNDSSPLYVPSTNYPIIPQPSLLKIIKALFVYLGLQIKENFFEQDFTKLLVILNVNDAVSAIYNSTYDGFSHSLTTYNLMNHLPDITIGEFLTALHNYFALDFNLTNDELRIVSIKDYISDNSYDDFTEISSRAKVVSQIDATKGINLKWSSGHPDENTQMPSYQDDIEEDPIIVTTDPNYPDPSTTESNTGLIVLPTNAGEYIPVFKIAQYLALPGTGEIVFRWVDYDYTQNEIDDFYCNLSQNYFNNIYSDDDILSVDLGLTPYFTKPTSWDVNPNYSRINQPGNSDLNFGNKQSYGLRLAFYRGLNQDDIPFMSHYYQDHQLDLWSAGGIFERYWQQVFQYLSNIDYQIEQSFLMSLKQIVFFDFAKKIKIGNELFFAKSLQFSIDIYGNLSSVDAVLMPTHF